MTFINLLPAHHRARLHAGRLTHRWIAGTSAYAVLLVVGASFAHSFCTIDDRSVTAEIQRLDTQSAQLEKVHAASLAQLKGVQSQAALRDAVNAPPDFAALLTAIAQSCGDDAILTALKWDNVPAPQTASLTGAPANPGDPVVAADPLAGLAGVKLEMSGLARAQPGVGLVVQRLQDTSLFEDVRLTKTSREGFLSGDALAFHITSLIDPAARRRSAP